MSVLSGLSGMRRNSSGISLSGMRRHSSRDLLREGMRRHSSRDLICADLREEGDIEQLLTPGNNRSTNYCKLAVVVIVVVSAAIACTAALLMHQSSALGPPTQLHDTLNSTTSSLPTTSTATTPGPPTKTTTTPSTVHHENIHNPDCLGFHNCPAYPEPYSFGKWPTSYEYTGTFPDNFVWGLGTASYQIEGAYREGGRGASIWDTFTGADTVGMPGANCAYCCKAAPCPVNNMMFDKGATGNVACDHYHMVEADVALMKSMGLKHYRFSIAWPRIFPTGKASDGINKDGVAFYNKLIDTLLAADITPMVTLYHWDLPQGLLDPPRLQGWWSRDIMTGQPNGQILPDFLDYVDACFSNFGDRVKVWVTFNEPLTFTWLASGWGKAPSIPEFSDQSIDPYIAAHNVLNAHAAAVDLYRRKYQPFQQGRIGITNNCDWKEPRTNSLADIAAAERAVEFTLGWFSDPIFSGTGDYPAAMRELFGDRLPKFTEAQKRLLIGSSDFFGLNHYGSGWASYTPDTPGFDTTYATVTEEGFPRAQSTWLFGVPWGLRKVLNWISRRYENPPIYVTESGWSLEANFPEEGAADGQRVAYYANYTAEVRKAIVEDGVDVRGYFAWSLMDNFEWERGYVERFGTTYTDLAFGMDTNAPTNTDKQPTSGKQMRRRKVSSCWLEAVWNTNTLIDPSSASFKGCVNSTVFATNYTDSKYLGCIRSIRLDSTGTTGSITGTIAAVGDTQCNGKTDIAWGPLPIVLSGGTIVADFSDSGGPSHLVGYWNDINHAIEWGDGTTWNAIGRTNGYGNVVIAK